ncbi:molecular chaperone DnaJ [Platysternon megacephalum]|uniref:Palmitoyl-protein thioesterase ABHD10, mitochondrial n=1 Tax=Platysternon megacephalum TaxID=55544 RepID=A0A4D9DJH3_9SAUR|nr:molecular chaperone DnaJ [Platysternon megacephalum]
MTETTPGSEAPPVFLTVGTGEDARPIAVRARPASPDNAGPGLIWLGGFMSDMGGTKARAVDQWAVDHGRACVRFDYSGHGESPGPFTDGTIGRWLAEAEAIFAQCCQGPQVVIGSSMGGWIALLLARTLAARAGGRDGAWLAGLVLVAPAPDFTEELMWKNLPQDVKDTLVRDGLWHRPSHYAEGPYPITLNLITEARNHLVLGSSIQVGCPVRILQGVQDPDVPWQHAFALTSRLPADDVVLTLVQDGDHRLSRPQDIARMLAAIAEVSASPSSADHS